MTSYIYIYMYQVSWQTLCILETNLDDLQPQIVGYLFEKLLEKKELPECMALDV